VTSPSYRRRMVQGVIAGGLLTPVLRATSLMTVPLLIRILGIDLYGVLSISLLMTGSQGLLDLGMTAAVIKYVAQAQARGDRRETWRVLRLGLVGYTIVNLLFAGIAVALLARLPDWLQVPGEQQNAARLILGASVITYAASNYVFVFAGSLQGMQRLVSVNVALAAGQAGYVVLLALTWLLGWGVAGVIVAQICLFGLQLVVLIPAQFAYAPRGPSAATSVSWRQFVRVGATVQFVTVADFAVFQAPKLLVGVALGASAAGRLDLAFRLPMVASALVMPMLPPLLPAAARAAAAGHRDMLSELYERGGRFLGLAAFPLTAGAFAFGPQLLEALVGDAAQGLDTVVRVLSVAMLAHTLPGAATAVAIGSGHNSLATSYKAIQLAIAAAGFILVRAEQGPLGPAVSVCIAFVVSGAYVMVRARRLFGGHGPSLAMFARPLLATIGGMAVAGVAYQLSRPVGGNLNMLVATAAGIAGYLIAIPLTGAFSSDDAALLLGRPATFWNRGSVIG
jgi:O-antigen/teichoic acid export membrane protein